MNTQSNLSVTQATNYYSWYAYYKGFVYSNKPTPIHVRINNKVAIDKVLTLKAKLRWA